MGQDPAPTTVCAASHNRRRVRASWAVSLRLQRRGRGPGRRLPPEANPTPPLTGRTASVFITAADERKQHQKHRRSCHHRLAHLPGGLRSDRLYVAEFALGCIFIAPVDGSGTAPSIALPLPRIGRALQGNPAPIGAGSREGDCGTE